MKGALEAASPEAALTERFGAAVARHLGLAFEPARSSLFRQTLEDRAAARRLPLAGYLDLFERPMTPSLRQEIGEVAASVTVSETCFFRNVEQIRAFQDLCLAPGRPRRDLRVLSAGCASGEEAYSLAIAVLERWPEAGPQTVSIVGADLNPRMLARARAGRYSAWSLRETPHDVWQGWFRREGADSVVDARVRALVTFEERNLAGEEATEWPAQSFDAIFFRNVLMYFTPDRVRQAVESLARALRPGGLLFLGYAETLRSRSQEFHLRHTHDTFYYQLRGPTERALPLEPFLASGAPPPRSETLAGASWVDAIRKASERVVVLTGAAKTPESSTGTLPERSAPRDLTSILALLREERFQDALASIAALPESAHRDPDVLQLTATLLVHAGRRAEAEVVAAELLCLDDLNVGAHYVLALCSEHAGQSDTALRHNRSAVHLDPSFSMAHVHLGILAKRANRRDEAQREFARALELLEGEDSSRILLFGGGFGRGALLAFCRNELMACRGPP